MDSHRRPIRPQQTRPLTLTTPEHIEGAQMHYRPSQARISAGALHAGWHDKMSKGSVGKSAPILIPNSKPYTVHIPVRGLLFMGVFRHPFVRAQSRARRRDLAAQTGQPEGV